MTQHSKKQSCVVTYLNTSEYKILSFSYRDQYIAAFIGEIRLKLQTNGNLRA